MIPISYLESLGARDVPHSGRTLFHHLFRTWQILVAWEVDEQICLGGLYHSTYATRRFASAIADYADREEIASVIGHRAERLAYLFSQIDPQSFFSRALPAAQIHRATAYSLVERSVATPLEIPDLAIIECANLYEQDQRRPSHASFLLECVKLCGARSFEKLQFRWQRVGASNWMLSEATKPSELRSH